MKRVIPNALWTVFLLLLTPSLLAEVTLPAIVSSNMVLQRNTTVSLWGWADAGEKISIEASWLDEALNVEADDQGNWSVEVETTNSKEAQTISIKSENSEISLENVRFGEVWICSGQSNMQQPVTGYMGQPTFGSSMAVAFASNPDLRLFTVDRLASKTPEKEVSKYTPWQEASPENVADLQCCGLFLRAATSGNFRCSCGHDPYLLGRKQCSRPG